MKRCSKCKQEKPTIGFNKDRKAKDGLQSWCKDCRRALGNAYDQSAAGKERHRRFKLKNRIPPGPVCYYRLPNENKHAFFNRTTKGKARYRRYRENHPMRIKARTAVWTAIDNGSLPKPTEVKCSCGQPAETYHHHNGYRKSCWLDVIPLCWPCHRAVDGE